MTLIVNIIRVLIILFIVRIIVSWFAGLRRPVGPAPRQSRVPERAGGTLVQDPHCGTYVAESRAVVLGSLKFCSTACRDAYQRNRVS